MTNGEKFKGEEASLAAYRNQMKKDGKTETLQGYAHWIAQEAKTEDPGTCPYCLHCNVTVRMESSSCNQVECLHCHARGPVCDTKDEAIERWNSVGHVFVHGKPR